MGYSIGQVAKKTGLGVHTLRYYEKEGLLPFVRKSGSGLRIYSDSDIGWLGMIECLKGTGMTLKGIKQYIDWYIEGDSTLEQRLEMFKRQKVKLEEQLAELQKNMAKIDYKISLYTEAVKVGSLEKVSSAPQFSKWRETLLAVKDLSSQRLASKQAFLYGVV